MTKASPRRARFAALVAAVLPAWVGAQPLKFEGDFSGAGEALDPVQWVLAQALPPGGPAPPRSSATLPGTPLPPPAPPTWTARMLPFLQTGEPAGFVPPRWGGSLALEYSAQSGEDGALRNLFTSVVSLNAASYFWQPWFAQVRGNLTLLGSLDYGKGYSTAAPDDTLVRGLSLSGGGTLSVFPNSRFPFLASLDSTDSRTTGDYVPTDQRSTRVSLRQTWRDPIGTTTYLAGVDYSQLDSYLFGRDSVLSMDGRYTLTKDPHRFDASVNLSRNWRESGGGESDFVRAYGTHIYTPHSDLWVNSILNLTDSSFEAGSAGARFSQRFGQFTSQAVWRPEFDDRLVVTGGGRLFANQFSPSGGRGSGYTLGGNAGATYALTEEATLNASATVTHIEVGSGASTLVRAVGGGGNYTSPPFNLGLANWSFSGSLQGAFQDGGQEGKLTVTSAQLDQQLARSVEFGRALTVYLLATQGVGVIDDSFIGRTRSVRAGVSGTLRVAASESSDAYFGTSYFVSDSAGAIEDRFQLANVQASGVMRFGPHDSLSANVTAQWTRSRREALASEEELQLLTGAITYQHNRVFGLPRLRYLLTASVNDGTRTLSRALGDVDAPRQDITHLVDQRLLFDIGRLEVRLGTRFARVDGRDDLQGYLRVVRQFGQY